MLAFIMNGVPPTKSHERLMTSLAHIVTLNIFLPYQNIFMAAVAMYTGSRSFCMHCENCLNAMALSGNYINYNAATGHCQLILQLFYKHNHGVEG
jgi:hypothetical protein